VVHGHHIYNDIWTPTIGEELVCRREVTGKVYDLHAVAVLRGSDIVGPAFTTHNNRHPAMYLLEKEV